MHAYRSFINASTEQVHKLDGQYRAAKEALEQDIAAAQSQVGCALGLWVQEHGWAPPCVRCHGKSAAGPLLLLPVAASSLCPAAPAPLSPHPQVDQLAAEVAHLRNANGASVLASEERLRALQAQYEDLLGCVWSCCAGPAAGPVAAGCCSRLRSFNLTTPGLVPLDWLAPPPCHRLAGTSPV